MVFGSLNLGGARPGTWVFRSPTDSRWNCDGRAEFILVSSGSLPKEAQEKLEELKVLYGEPPDDLEVSCWKD